MLRKYRGKRRGNPIVHSPRLESLEGRVLLSLTGTGIDPANMGKGEWIPSIEAAEADFGVGSLQQLATILQGGGVRWVAVQAGNGDDGPLWNYNDGTTGRTVGSFAPGDFSTGFGRDVIDTFHANGIKVFGYHYIYGGGTTGDSTLFSVPALEKKVAKDILSLGCDGLIVDSGSEFEAVSGNAAVAKDYLQAARGDDPQTFLAYTPGVYVDQHTDYPYATFSQYCDAAMPQAFFLDLPDAGNSPEKMVADMDSQWKTLYNGFTTGGHADYVKPIVPVGQGSDTTTKHLTESMIGRWFDALALDETPASPGGYEGTSFYPMDLHTPSIWKGIVNNDIGNPGGIVTGSVFNDHNGDGFQSSAEHGLLGWTVYADANDNGQLDSGEAQTTTDSDGNFTLFWLPAGQQIIRLSQPSAWRQTSPADGFKVLVQENQTTAAGAFGTTHTALIRGNVYDDANLSGMRDGKEAGLSHVRVYADLNNDGVFESNEPFCFTHSSGAYFLSIGTGHYVIRHDVPAGYRGILPNRGFARVAAVKRGHTYAFYNFGDSSTALIKGTVFVDENKNGVKTSNEAGYAGATVYLDQNNDGKLDDKDLSTKTNPGGVYRFNVAAGTYTVRAEAPKGATLTGAGVYVLNVSSGDSQTHEDFGLNGLFL